MQAKQLDPDNPAMMALAEMAQHEQASQRRRANQGRQGRNVPPGAERHRETRAVRRHRQPGRGPPAGVAAGTAAAVRTTDTTSAAVRPAEYEIEMKLDKPISIEFSQTPLDQAIDNLKDDDQAAAGDRHAQPGRRGDQRGQADHGEAGQGGGRPAHPHLRAGTGRAQLRGRERPGEDHHDAEGQGAALHEGVLGRRPRDADPELRAARTTRTSRR